MDSVTRLLKGYYDQDWDNNTKVTVKRLFTELLRYYYRSSHRRCSIKKGFLKISQYSQESTCVGVSF